MIRLLTVIVGLALDAGSTFQERALGQDR